MLSTRLPSCGASRWSVNLMSIKSDFAQLLSSSLAFLSTRASMATLEWQQAQARWRRVAISLAIVALLLFSVWLLCHVALIAYVWDTPYRYAVLGGLIVVYAIVAMVLLLRALRLCQQPTFPHTTMTLKADVDYFTTSNPSAKDTQTVISSEPIRTSE